jgi:thiamine-monophosphate kinase
MQICDLGEQGLLKLIQPYCVPQSIGDDAAILTPPVGKNLVVTTDVLVEGVHFSDRTTTANDVGWRSVVANLSDLAAMGAYPLAITVGLSLPGDLSVSWLEELYRGMNACLSKYQTGIIGGDLTRSSVITIAITALGAVTPDRVIRRDTAQVGDAIVVSGYHGNAHGGLKLLLDPGLGEHLQGHDRARLILAHQRPQPRLDILPRLDQWRSGERSSLRISGMDSSDGLADAILQICRASGVGANIDRQAIPIDDALWQLSPTDALKSILYGGEDFELVLCLPYSIAVKLVPSLGEGAAIIGEIVPSEGAILVDSQGEYESISLDMKSGFQHF